MHRKYGSVEKGLNPGWQDEENWMDRILSELALKAEEEAPALAGGRVEGIIP